MDYNKSFEKFVKGCHKNIPTLSSDISVEMNKDMEEEESDYQCLEKAVTQKYSTDSENSANTALHHNKDDNHKENSMKQLNDIMFEDIPETPDATYFFRVKHHSAVYPLPIMTNPKYKKYSWQKRSKFMSVYYKHIENLKKSLTRKSLYFAPYPKPISSSVKHNSWLARETASKQQVSGESAAEVYISRAGRQIKRKSYAEDAENDYNSDDSIIKAFTTKKSRTNSNDKRVLSDSFSSHIGDEQNDNPLNISTRGNKKYNLSLNAKKLSRSEVLFANLVHEEEKKKETDKKVDTFKKTLMTTDDDSVDQELAVQEATVSDHESEVKNKTLKNKFRFKLIQQSNAPATEKIEKFGETDFIGGGNNKLYSTPMTSKEALKESTNEMDCPICNKKFAKDKIEDHASTCGLDEEPNGIYNEPNNTPQQNKSYNVGQKMVCQVCKTEFYGRSSFNAHVKECVASTVDNM